MKQFIDVNENYDAGVWYDRGRAGISNVFGFC